MAGIENKFIFTNEGRCSLISQLNGIRFAILGAILVQGLEPVIAQSDELYSELYDKYGNLTLDDLSINNGIILAMNNVSYISLDNQKLYIDDLDEYTTQFENIAKNTLPVHYIPSQEIMDNANRVYGTYELDLDKTAISWDMKHDIAFSHIILLGKQYAETNDATFNVANTQKPVIVGIAQLEGAYDETSKVFTGGLQLLAEQNKFTATKLKIRFTLDDLDNDVSFIVNDEIKEISDKINLVNNGLKTMPNVGVSMSIAGDKTIIDDLNLSTEGAIATTKTLMVADPFAADELENQLNPAALLHIVNKEEDDKKYRDQLVFTTIQKPLNLENQPLTAYSTKFVLQGKGKEKTAYINNPYIEDISILSGNGNESPLFRIDTCSVDDYAVDIFGLENNILNENNIDKMLFSQNNISTNKDEMVTYTENVLIKSSNNKLDANLNNLLINTDYNVINDYANSNVLIHGQGNIITTSAVKNTLIGTDFNEIDGRSSGNLVLGGTKHIITTQSHNNILLGHEGLKAAGSDEQLILGKYNIPVDGPKVIYGIGTDDDNRQNALEFYPESGVIKLFKDGRETIALGGDVGINVTNLSVSSITSNNINTDKITATQGFYLKSDNTANDPATASLYYADNNSAINWYIKSPGQSFNELTYNTDSNALTIFNSNYGISDGSTAKLQPSALSMTAIDNNTTASVTLTPSSINFYNSSFTEPISLSYKDIPEYHKIKVDVLISGDSVTSWGVSDIKIIGTEKSHQYMNTILTDLFKNKPVFMYTSGNAPWLISGTAVSGDGYYVNYNNQTDHLSDISDAEQYKNIINNENISNSIVTNYLDPRYLMHNQIIYGTDITTWDFSELEINIFNKFWWYDNDPLNLFFAWLPYLNNNNFTNKQIPSIRVNIYDCNKMFCYRNEGVYTTINGQSHGNNIFYGLLGIADDRYAARSKELIIEPSVLNAPFIANPQEFNGWLIKNY